MKSVERIMPLKCTVLWGKCEKKVQNYFQRSEINIIKSSEIRNSMRNKTDKNTILKHNNCSLEAC